VISVWIFIICGQLCIFYTRELIANLKLLNFVVRNTSGVPNRIVAQQRTFAHLGSLKKLYEAADLLHHHFSTILAVNCFLTVVTMLTSSYYVIEFFKSGRLIPLCWDASDVLDSFVRFWLICHTSDRIRETVIIMLFRI
jgi:hypothetical protein